MNRIRDIAQHGQSIWYDYIQRSMIWTGSLYRMVEEDGLKGVTSNPAIFEKAISKSTDYRSALSAIVRAGASSMESFESMAIEDIQLATDVLRKVYDETNGRDGYVSLEVSPHLAFDKEATVEEAMRLWEQVGRDNLMIKIPATEPCLDAIEKVIAEGINVNVTLLFSVDRYEAAARAYMRGLEKWTEKGGDPKRVASVASFFISRIDSLVDKLVDERCPDRAHLKGKVAVASAKMAYRAYEQLSASDQWKALAAKGARPQRLLWASTSTKNPDYNDVLYVEELIANDTVNTVPESTYNAFLEHGKAEPDRIHQDLAGAENTLKELAAADISLKAVTDQLLEEGVVKFQDAFDRLMATVEQRRVEILGERLPKLTMSGVDISEQLSAMRKAGFMRRLWANESELWNGDEMIERFMGWLDVVDELQDQPEHFLELQENLQSDGIEYVVLMGMGGSSLAPDVFTKTYGEQQFYPKLLVLDSTVPAQVQAIEEQIDLKKTVFIVASKSGTTTEPLAFDSYFYDKVKKGAQFMAITDPDSKLEALAVSRDYRSVFLGDPEIGGRYSALSPFGMVPAASMGLDVIELLLRARQMVGSCEAMVPPEENAGVLLGTALGKLANEGRDKLTLVASASLSYFGAWVEQLIAESTGKHGKGIVPVDLERLGNPEVYRNDRVFLHLKLKEEQDDVVERRLDALKEAGHPVLRIELADKRDIVQEMYRFQIATATAAHLMGVNPFDQPNVQESKAFTSDLLSSYEKDGALPPVEGEVQLFEEDGVAVYADQGYKENLGDVKTLKDVLSVHLRRIEDGDYVAFNAYVEMCEENDEVLQRMRHQVRDAHKVATTLGYGPRFLHSTGQLHKGGANNGVFLQITCDDAVDMPVPGKKFTFGVLKTAQQAGDFMALARRERRLLRIHLPKDVKGGLETLANALKDAGVAFHATV